MKLSTSKPTPNIHREHSSRSALPLCGLQLEKGMRLFLVLLLAWRALLGVFLHKDFQLRFPQNVDFELPAKISPEGKYRFRRKLATELSSAIAM